MGYWKTKVLPKIKKVFEKNGPKKAAAAEATKTFDESKEEINKEFEEKRVDLGPKVVEIYKASSIEIQTLVKDRTDAGVKKHSVAVTKYLEELVKIDFPGSKAVSEAAIQFGPALVSGPVIFLFEKVAALLPVEETTAPAAEETPPATAEETTSKDKDVVVDEIEKKDKDIELKVEEATDPTTSTTTTTTDPPAVVEEPAKIEEAPPTEATPVEAAPSATAEAVEPSKPAEEAPKA